MPRWCSTSSFWEQRKRSSPGAELATMFTTSAAEFLSAYSAERFPPRHPATARAAFLVSPEGFSLAGESARDNVYMRMGERADPARALAEHAALARALATE